MITHKGDVNFYDLSLKEKRRSIVALLERMKSYNSVSNLHDTEIDCQCQLSEIEQQSEYLNEIHHMVADHFTLK